MLSYAICHHADNSIPQSSALTTTTVRRPTNAWRRYYTAAFPTFYYDTPPLRYSILFIMAFGCTSTSYYLLLPLKSNITCDPLRKSLPSPPVLSPQAHRRSLSFVQFVRFRIPLQFYLSAWTLISFVPFDTRLARFIWIIRVLPLDFVA